MIMVKNSPAACLVFALLAFGPLPTRSQTVTKDKPYVPKFVRVERTAQILDSQTCKPEYPRNSARNEEEGTATIAATISSNGQFLSSVVVKSSGFRDLDKATVTTFANCKFRPALINGKPVQSISTVTYEWKIE